MIALALLLSLAAPDAQSMRRYAFVVGSNDGGKERVRLRYANTDAASLARVLTELGGVGEQDLVLLRDATEPLFRRALSDLQARIASERRATERAELFVYYSGHSDEEGLLLAGARLPYRELRTLIARMPADVKIAIVDSCASGALVRLKGGERRAAFLVDASASASGHAFITSSSADEAAQESDRIAGSFFTHFLVSGLRGAADTTGDKRVTLNEAYHFAFNETLQRTERTQSGPQHPSYDIQLQGSGDLVMTDVRSTRAGVVFDEPVDGRLFVRDAAGRLVVEVDKARGRRVEIGLAAGRYAITRDRGGKLTLASTEVSEGQRVSIDEDAFVAIDRERTVRRGDGGDSGEASEASAASSPGAGNGTGAPVASPLPASPGARPAWAPRESPPPPRPRDLTEPRRVAAVVGFAGSLHTGRRLTRAPDTRFMLTGLHLRVHALHGLALGFGVSSVRDEAKGAMLSVIANHTSGKTTGFHFAAGANLATEWMRGVQWSGGFNYAEALTGAQLSTVNVAKGMRGVQIGLVNYASNVEKGFQLGLVNISKHSDGEALGLFTYAGNVPIRLSIFTSDVNAFNVGVRYGSKHLYGIVLGGLQPFFGTVRGSLGLGGGVHVPFWHLYFDADLSGHLVMMRPLTARTPHWLFQARALIGGQLAERFAVFVGATFNLSLMLNPVLASDETIRNVTIVPRTNAGAPELQVWPGFIAEIQI